MMSLDSGHFNLHWISSNSFFEKEVVTLSTNY